MAKTAPPTMEELAKQQLSATQSITAAINSLGDRTGLALATTKTVGKGLKAGRAAAEGISNLPSEGLSAKKLGDQFDTLAGAVSGSIEQYVATGNISAGLGTALGNFGSYITNEMVQSFSNVKTETDKFVKEFPIFSDIAKAAQRAVGNVTGVPSTTNVTTGADPVPVTALI